MSQSGKQTYSGRALGAVLDRIEEETEGEGISIVVTDHDAETNAKIESEIIECKLHKPCIHMEEKDGKDFPLVLFESCEDVRLDEHLSDEGLSLPKITLTAADGEGKPVLAPKKLSQNKSNKPKYKVLDRPSWRWIRDMV